MILLLWGCAYTLHIDSRPAPAVLTLPDDSRAITPTDIRLRWKPFRKQVVTISASGHRPLELDVKELRLRSGRAFSGQRGDVELLLVPDHGPAGTWRLEDVPD